MMKGAQVGWCTLKDILALKWQTTSNANDAHFHV